MKSSLVICAVLTASANAVKSSASSQMSASAMEDDFDTKLAKALEEINAATTKAISDVKLEFQDDASAEA